MDGNVQFTRTSTTPTQLGSTQLNSLVELNLVGFLGVIWP